MDMKLEVVAVPVTDVERAEEFYKSLGWRLDADLGSGPGRVGQHRSYQSFASFSDPDGNEWVLQEITQRLPGR